MMRRKLHDTMARINGSAVIDERIDSLESEVVKFKADTKAELSNIGSLLRQTATDLKATNKQVNSEEISRVASRKKQPAVFVLSAHDWGNLGDLAIGYAQTALLESIFPDREIFTVSRFTLLSNWQRFKNLIRNDDLLTIIGGGNMGDIWIAEERARRKIVESFPDNPIVSFPQSIKFDDESELIESSRIYNAHKKLLIAVRDDDSLKIANKHFNRTNILRTEDIVLSYEFPTPHQSVDDRVVYVTRNDKEKRNVPALDIIHGIIDRSFRTHSTDTVEDIEFSGQGFGAVEVYLKIDEIQASRLVVTDRLHGAIFALLAGKPTIVVDNSYGKIKGALKNVAKALGNRVLFARDDAANVTEEVIRAMYSMQSTDLRPHTIINDDIKLFSNAIKKIVE